MAIRTSQVLSLLPNKTVDYGLRVQAALKESPHCKKSQQKFLHPESNDMQICKGRKGQGGNTVGQHCHIIKQITVDPNDIEKICKGK